MAQDPAPHRTATSSHAGRRRLLSLAMVIIALTTALVGFAAAPASAATYTLTATDTTGGSKVTVSYTPGNGSITWTFKLCDTKADGHHSVGWMSFKHREGDLDDWSGFTDYKLTEYDGNGSCTSIARISYYCQLHFYIETGTYEGSTRIGSHGGNDRIVYANC
jgi:hypothetical protein